MNWNSAVLILHILISVAAAEREVTKAPNEPKCRDRDGYYIPSVFKLHTCAMCSNFLFNRGPRALVGVGVWMASVNRTNNTYKNVVQADISNEESVRTVCATLTDNQCKRWLACCEDAIACCDEQLNQWSHDAPSSNTCPATWDGFSCWDSTPANSVATINCPAFMDDHAMPSVKAQKSCTSNGTWYRHLYSNQEWSNYTACADVE